MENAAYWPSRGRPAHGIRLARIRGRRRGFRLAVFVRDLDPLALQQLFDRVERERSRRTTRQAQQPPRLFDPVVSIRIGRL
jgi:hypothetical protein